MRGIDGVLYFDSMRATCPRGHLPIDDATVVESLSSVAPPTRVSSCNAFRLRTGAGATQRACAAANSSRARGAEARFDGNDWVQAIRTVVEQRTLITPNSSVAVTPAASPAHP